MGTLEIVLLLVGGVIFVLSFIIPSKMEGMSKETRELVEDEVKNIVNKEMDGMKGKIEDIVDETVTYAMEKTERSLERVSNEKIMAVNEYSDTVLEDINKNHKEVMFLYDMLNDKHQNIKNTVSEVEKTVKEVEQTAKTGKKKEIVPKPVDESVEEKEDDFVVLMPGKAETTTKAIKRKTPAKTAKPADAPELDISFMKEGRKNGNNNERILELHNSGKSNVAIAKELGLGVGEVKLVIDLFEGM